MRNLLCTTISLAALCAAFAQPAHAQQGGLNTSGRLQNGDATLESGEYSDRYTIQAQAGQTIDVRMTSADFDTYLIVRGPNDTQFDNDDENSANGTNSRITEVAPVSGTYRISATTYQAGEGGSYQLRANVQGAANARNDRGSGQGGSQAGGIDTPGRLQSGDNTLDSGEFVDRYSLEAVAGQTIDVRMTSSEVDPYLIIRGPNNEQFDNDDEDGSTNARITEVAPTSGTYRISATTYEPGETGGYRLQASAQGGNAQSNGGGRNQGASGTAQSGFSGSLAAGDGQLDSGEYTDAYTITGRAGQQVTVNLTSADFDTYLLLRGPDGSSFDNDDGDDMGTNSQITVTLPANGSYRLVATSYRPGETGSYSLQLRGATAVAAAATGGSGVGGAAAGGTLAAGRPVTGNLASADNALDSGEYFDSYLLTGEPGAQFVVEMTSSALDTYLMAVGAGGYQVTNDDDASGNNGTNSALEVTIPDTGELTIAATSYAAGETGAYTLVARRAGYVASNNNGGSGGQRLALGQNVNGNLAGGDQTYTLTVDQGGPVRIALDSDAFDTVLRVEGPGGFSAENDDAASGGTLNSLLETNLPGAGTYRVVVSSYGEAGAGAYRLAANSGGSGSNGDDRIAGGAGTLALGNRVSGALATGDETISSGEFIDSYTFQGQRGQRVTFDMASEDFDTYLSLLFPGGGSEENDDRAGGDGSTDSRLTVTLPANGTYQLVATSYQPGDTGGYSLSMNTAAATDISANPARPNSRVFALSVGVADYERISGLNMTDQDALKLTQALSATGMLAPESATLVNASATRENFAAAIQNIAANIGPDDLFLLFFSGHGAKNEVDRSIERDGSSETIELFDDAVADYELEQMLAPISSRILLVLDSCFSGGFDGLINASVGRMGVFSSDSDVTSLVADKFEAGGYISHILQLAVEGRADANHDAAITAGELSEFMRTTFYQIALDEPLESSFQGAGGNSGTGYQHIVVNRGGDGMPYEDVLVNLTASGG